MQRLDRRLIPLSLLKCSCSKRTSMRANLTGQGESLKTCGRRFSQAISIHPRPRCSALVATIAVSALCDGDSGESQRPAVPLGIAGLFWVPGSYSQPQVNDVLQRPQHRQPFDCGSATRLVTETGFVSTGKTSLKSLLDINAINAACPSQGLEQEIHSTHFSTLFSIKFPREVVDLYH